MSPLLRDEMEILLSPSQVSMTRKSIGLSRHGLQRRLLAQASIECPPPATGAPVWSGALFILDQQMRGLAGARANLHIVLSSQFVRYAIVPWQAGLNGREDTMYVRQYCAQMFGTSADDWDICVDATRSDEPRLASAIDAALLMALREVCALDAVLLKTVRPQLAIAFDRCRSSLPASGWIVLVEAGCVCIGLFEQGRWLSVQTVRTGEGGRQELSALLAREACLANPSGEVKDVFLWDPAHLADTTRSEGGFRFHALAGPRDAAGWGAAR